jgi:hypothetical protein
LEDFCSSSVFYQETGLLLISSAWLNGIYWLLKPPEEAMFPK